MLALFVFIAGSAYVIGFICLFVYYWGKKLCTVSLGVLEE